MKLIGWALAIAAAGLIPATASAQVPETPPVSEVATPGGTTQVPGQGATTGEPMVPAEALPPISSVAEIGQPVGGKGIQYQVTDIGRYAADFHNYWLLLLCALISLFVLGLLAYTIIRYRRGAHPTPSRTSHNTALEVAWTLIPVLVLVAIAIPSMRLLSRQYTPPPADLTIKVIGNQWYWTYQYPDNGDIEIVSNMLKEQGDARPGERFRTDADGPALMAVDERLVIPAGKVVKFLVTSNDVIHSFGVPAFWTKMDANPGRINETWVKVDEPGVYFGQCYELCGARHAYMPIAVEVVPEERFAAWIASKGGTMPGAKPVAMAPPGDAGLTPVTPVGVEPSQVRAPVEQPALNQSATAQN